MTIEVEATAAAADRLSEALHSGIAVAPVRDLLDNTLEAGYAVQQVLTARAVESGRRIIGRKIGLTNPAVQQQLGVNTPDIGVLFHDMQVAANESVPVTRLVSPRIEAEIAFVLGQALDGEIDDSRARQAVAELSVSLEIVDSRIRDWDIQLVDTVADNASSGLFVLSDQRFPLEGLDLVSVRMEMLEDGVVVSTGTGADCLGDPVAALVWLARTADELGWPLRAGDIILSGALGPMVKVRAGSDYRANVGELGSVSVRFTEGATS